MIIASMCTIPVRKESFDQVLQSILFEQTLRVDRFHIWLNGYQQIPSGVPIDDRLIFHLEPSNPGPTVRYRSAIGSDDGDIFLTLDDDLIYPADYVEKGILALSRQVQQACVSFGGVFWDWVVPPEALDYRIHKRLILYHGGLETDTQVPVLMGGAGFHYAKNVQSVISNELSGFKTNDDLMVSYNLQKQGVSIISAVKPQDWIQEHPFQNFPNALYQRDVQTRVDTLREMVTRLGFFASTPMNRFEKDQMDHLVVSIGIIGDEVYKDLKNNTPESVSLHTFEILSSTDPAQNTRLLRDCHEHFIQLEDETGRFESVPGIRLFRKLKVDRANWKKVKTYLHWITTSCDVRSVKILGSSTKTDYLSIKLRTWADSFTI